MSAPDTNPTSVQEFCLNFKQQLIVHISTSAQSLPSAPTALPTAPQHVGSRPPPHPASHSCPITTTALSCTNQTQTLRGKGALGYIHRSFVLMLFLSADKPPAVHLTLVMLCKFWHKLFSTGMFSLHLRVCTVIVNSPGRISSCSLGMLEFICCLQKGPIPKRDDVTIEILHQQHKSPGTSQGHSHSSLPHLHEHSLLQSWVCARFSAQWPFHWVVKVQRCF